MKHKKMWCMLLAASVIAGSIQVAEAAPKTVLKTKKMVLLEGEKKQIKLKNKNKKAIYRYRSSAVKKIRVSAKGLVMAKKQGTAKITVTEQIKKTKKVRKVGVVTVVCKRLGKPAVNPTNPPIDSVTPAPISTPENPVVTASATPVTAWPLPSIVPVPTPSPSSVPEATPIATPTQTPVVTPEPTPDVYTTHVMTMVMESGEMYSVNGDTCQVEMQYFKGSVSGDFFTGQTKKDGTVVTKRYKEGETKVCSRYMLSGTDPDGQKCSVFIEENGVASEDGSIVTRPTVITDSKALAWLETADLQGRIGENEEGQKIMDIFWNETNEEAVTPPPIVRPDTTKDYSNEVLTVTIDIGATDAVSGSTGNASMIHFKGASDCANFKGEIVDDCVDTRLKYKGQIETLSARYILTGTDAQGNPCNIYVENNGIDDNGMVTEPIIITDCPELAWIETAPLHGTVSWSPKLTIHLSTTK